MTTRSITEKIHEYADENEATMLLCEPQDLYDRAIIGVVETLGLEPRVAYSAQKKKGSSALLSLTRSSAQGMARTRTNITTRKRRVNSLISTRSAPSLVRPARSTSMT